jgi:hypothetical protein
MLSRRHASHTERERLIAPSAADLESFGPSDRMQTFPLLQAGFSSHTVAAGPVCARLQANAAHAYDFLHKKQEREQSL